MSKGKIRYIFPEMIGMNFHIKKGQVIKAINEKTTLIMTNHCEISEYIEKIQEEMEEAMARDFTAAITERRRQERSLQNSEEK